MGTTPTVTNLPTPCLSTKKHGRSWEKYQSYYSERFIGDTGVTFSSYEANSDGNRVSPIKRSH